MSARTQKAKGVFELARRGLISEPFLIQFDTDIESHTCLPWAETFARPCPIIPRHGFVESRVVNSIAELSEVWAETKHADPDGELLLMQYIDAKRSAVITPAAVVVGAGHDGATSGAAGSVTLPLAYVDVTPYAREELGVFNTPYVESVQAKNLARTVYLVQIRDGVKPPETLGNYVPHDVTVTQVLTAGGDLLEWEQLIKSATAGTVAHHPDGNLLSHYSVHAVTHSIPIIFDQAAPRVGDTLAATVTGQTQFDIPALRQGIAAGMNFVIDGTDNLRLIRIVFFALHQSAALKTTAAGCQVIGIAAALFARFTTAACLGELRHYKYGRPRDRGLARHQVYERVFENYPKVSLELKRAWKIFFTGKWASNFGGKAWAKCTYETIKLDRAIYDVCNADTQEAAANLLAQLNINVNLAHNGGWWLNKFCNKSTMDSQANGKLTEILEAAYEVVPLVTTAGQTAPAIISARIPLPQKPVRIFHIRLGHENLYLQIGNRHEHHSNGLSISPKQKSDIQSLIEIFRLPESKSFNGSCMYRKASPAFLAALQLTDESTYEDIIQWQTQYKE